MGAPSPARTCFGQHQELSLSDTRRRCGLDRSSAVMLHRRVLALALVLLALTRTDAFAAKKVAKGKAKKAASSSKAKGGFGASKVATGPTPAQLLTASIKQYEALEKFRNEQNTAEAEAEFGEQADDEREDKREDECQSRSG